jgi:hypothetical protein
MGVEGALQSEFGEKIRNLTGILQDKFPSVDISDIPGLNTGGDLTPTTRCPNYQTHFFPILHIPICKIFS